MLPEQNELIETLYRKYYRKILAYTTSGVQNSDRAQDIVQDVFHEAIRRINVVSAHENPGGWLMVTAKNKIQEYKRARNRDLRCLTSLDYDISVDSLQDIDNVQEEPLIKRIKSVLSASEFRLLCRFVFEDASHLELAREFGISVYASQKRLERIRKKLYKIFPDGKR